MAATPLAGVFFGSAGAMLAPGPRHCGCRATGWLWLWCGRPVSDLLEEGLELQVF